MIVHAFVTDDDECRRRNGGCTQKCVNTDGSFVCKCKPGFKLAADGKTCKGQCSLAKLSG